MCLFVRVAYCLFLKEINRESSPSGKQLFAIQKPKTGIGNEITRPDTEERFRLRDVQERAVKKQQERDEAPRVTAVKREREKI